MPRRRPPIRLAAVALFAVTGCVPHVPLVPGDPTLPGMRGRTSYAVGDLHRVVIAEPANATLDAARFVFGTSEIPLARTSGSIELAGGRLCRRGDVADAETRPGPAWTWNGDLRADAAKLRVRRAGVEYESRPLTAPNAAIEAVYVTDLSYDPSTDAFEGTLRLFANADRGAPCVDTKAGSIRFERAKPRRY